MFKINSSLRATLLLGASGAAVFSYGAAAFAQQTTETVVITGSRIPNRDFSSDSPLTTVSADTLSATGAIEVQQTLSSLPQVVASVSQGSNNPAGGGAESISVLRARKLLTFVD